MNADNIHVVPVNDLREHDLSPDCWCNPTPHDDCPGLWTHHSMDRREEFEEGRKETVMTPKEINDLKKQHNVLLEQGQQVYSRAMDLHDQCLDLQRRIQKAEGDDYDPVPHIFGAGFWIDPEL